MAFTRLLRNLARDERFGQRVVPIIPDEARTFGMDALFRELKIYAAQGQRYEPVDHDLLLSYTESKDGQILEEGITEAGSMATFIAAATSYAHRGVPMVPFYIFYSMFGFQRTGDLIWLAADARAKGFLMGATAGRTTLLGEGLQHQDGHSLVLASTVPPCQAYDPAFAYEVATIVKHGIRRMYGPGAGGRLLLPHPLQRELPDAGHARACPASRRASSRGCTSGPTRPRARHAGPPCCSPGTAQGAARQAAAELAEHYDVGVELWSATSYKALREEALDVERWNRLHPGQRAEGPARHPAPRRRAGPGRGRHRLHEDRARPGRAGSSPTGRSSRWAPTASAAPTPVRRCAACSRWTRPTSWSPCSPAWPSRATPSPRRWPTPSPATASTRAPAPRCLASGWRPSAALDSVK